MKRLPFFPCTLVLCCCSGLLSADDFPLVADDVEVALFASDPLVRNPCAITFDSRGRLCVGMGPQYRNPEPDTAGDSVFILIDADADGVADGRREFATGFNAIQGLAWRGDALWVANAPDLTVVRDLDGDGEADEYVRLYTDLGNLEHGLHGLNWAPDGRLYMSKGNSKGLANAPERMAPKPFRDLWGMRLPEDTPVFPAPVSFSKATYRKNYHDPSDDWGLCGGVLRCDPDGSNLEIVSSGFRNPWDIAFDDGFNWLGTDNDQTQGDKLVAPFFGAHFGWGHPWSHDWKGDDHLPSAPSAGPLFDGSGTGVVHCAVPGYPEHYRGVFFVNDWLRREIYLYRPHWDGAWMKPQNGEMVRFAHAGGGRSMEKSSGRSFDPVDIEIGPDGAIYVSSWGRQYGTVLDDGEMVNEGRIYRFRPRGFALQAAADDRGRARPIRDWTPQELVADLDSPLPVRRIDAQDELVRRGTPIAIPESASRQLATWVLWANGRMPAASRFPVDEGVDENLRIQSLRILGFRRERSDAIAGCLDDASARIRHEAVLALHQGGFAAHAGALLDLAARERDRVVFYSAWQALRALLPPEQLKPLLDDEREGVRRAALLALLEDDALSNAELDLLKADGDAVVAALVNRRLGGKAPGVIKGGKLAGAGDDAGQPADSRLRPLDVAGDIQPRRGGGRYEQAVLQAGTAAYSDRGYRITKVPDSLAGATFIRAANNDADPHEGTGFALDLRYPSSVFLADDRRGEQLPEWARGRFEKTPMTIAGDDATYAVYQARYPAGQTSFGPNRQGVEAGKAHYIVIVQPQTILPPATPTTFEEVLPLVAEADIEHGRNLFFQPNGATCSLCHRLEGRGNDFAPDLSGIGTRADAGVIVRSILDPSAEITEGFATQILTLKDGSSVAGILLEETGRVVRMSPGGGQVLEIPKPEIVQREGTALSAMPAMFHSMLRPGDVAAITRYLLTAQLRERPATPAAQGTGGETPPEPVEVKPAPAPTRPDALAGKHFGTAPGFELTITEDRLEVRHRGAPLADYIYRHPEIWRPFLAGLKTPGGLQVTRNFPPQDGDPDDHWNMHPGLSLGFAVLDGVNFWHNREGSIVHDGFHEVRAGADGAAFTAVNRYLDAGGVELCRETAAYRVVPNADGWLLTLDTRITASRPVAFGVKEEMGLALRVATPITVRHGSGSILSAAGGMDEKGTWGKPDKWWDYFGPIGDRSAGVQIMSAPGNPEVWAHSRDYGVLVANPFPVDVAENRDKETRLPAGEPLRLRFGVQVHGHATRDAYDPERAYSRYLEALRP